MCPPDMHMFDSDTLRWKRVKGTSQNPIPVSGRKNFAMSFCEDQIFMTGGMDNGQNLINDFKVMSINSGNWSELRVARKKDEKKRDSMQVIEQASNGTITRNASMTEMKPPMNSGSTRTLAIDNTESVESTHNMPRGLPSPPPPHLSGSDGKPRRRLLKRSHHTINTMPGKSEKLRNGYKMDHYISYAFGGLIQETDGRFCPTNDLLEIVTKNVIVDKS